MKISLLTKLSGIACIIMSILTVGLLLLMSINIDKERRYAHRQLAFQQLGHDLGQASDFLTKEARRYTVFGDKRHHDAYWKEVNELKTRDKIVARLKELGAAPLELELIQTAKANSDALIATENKAMKAVAQGNLAYAQTLMFDENYDRNKKIIMTPIKEFQRVMNLRAENEARMAKRQANILLWLTNAVIFIYIFLVIFVLYFVFSRKVSRPLHNISQAITQIASGKTGVVIPYTHTDNEIGELAKAAKAFEASLIQNQNLAIDLKRHQDNLEQEVTDRTKELTEANNELEEFAYRTSHDLRSPIISSVRLLSMTEKYLNSHDEKKAHMSLSHARKALQKLETLLEDIIILTKSKTQQEEAQNIDIQSLVSSALENMQHMENFERLDIQTDFQFNETLHVKKLRLNMILENLVSNAIKYQDIKKENSYLKISTQNKNNCFILEMKDNGLGVPKAQQDKLFTMFNRLHPKVAFGSGLGLYLMKKSAEVLNGEISFQAHDEGSIFRLTIPL